MLRCMSSGGVRKQIQAKNVNLKLLEKYGYKADSDRNQNEVVQWDTTKLEFFIDKLTQVRRKLYITPSLLLFVNKFYHPVTGTWDKETREKIYHFSQTSHLDLLKQKIDEVYGNEPFVEEVHQSYSKKKITRMQVDDHLEKLDMVKRYHFQGNATVAKTLPRIQKSRLKARLVKMDTVLRNEIIVDTGNEVREKGDVCTEDSCKRDQFVRSNEDKQQRNSMCKLPNKESDGSSIDSWEESEKQGNLINVDQSKILRNKGSIDLTKEKKDTEYQELDKDEYWVDDLVLTVCKNHQLHRYAKCTRKVVEVLVRFGFNYHEIALADPKIFRIKQTDKLVEVLSEKFETTNLKYDEICSEVEKRVKSHVSSAQIAKLLHIHRKHVVEQRTVDKMLSRNEENLLKNLKFLTEAKFNPYEILACLVILNFSHDSLQQSFVDASSEFDSNDIKFVNCPAGRVSLLYHMHLKLSKQESGNPIDLDELDQDDTITSSFDRIPNTDKEGVKYRYSLIKRQLGY